MRKIVQVPSDGWLLAGILNTPAVPKNGKRIGVPIFFDGMTSKSGTHFFYRKVADALSQAGYYALRCDNRGLCDSPEINPLAFDLRIADAMNMMRWFKTHEKLDKVVPWGLCIGSAVAIHAASAMKREEAPDALMLCNILCDSEIVTTAELGFARVEPKRILSEMFLRGNLLKKLLLAPTKLHIYRQNWTKIGRGLWARYVKKIPGLDQTRAGIAEVPGLLQRYDKPHVLIYGEIDTYRTSFLERVNPGDRLGLGRKATPPHWFMIKDATHTFASAKQAKDAIATSIEWLDAFVEGRDPGPHFSYARREDASVSHSPAA
jgi:pimeloyl-ACP methyl ester carboxylesterase